MVTMTVLPRGRPLTRADLEQMPDDGHRYELLDGALLVTPAPSVRHQHVLGRLYAVLDKACAADLLVLFAPVDVPLTEHTVLQPDLLVVRKEDVLAERPLRPLLAVEVLSPSTRRLDLTVKREALEASGCPSYWTVDPEAAELRAWELREGRYVEVAHLTADEAFVFTHPFVVGLAPAQLTAL